MAAKTDSRVRYVMRNPPGPNWRCGIDFREQEGIEAHVNHYPAVLAAGQFELCGPVTMADLGGMMIPIEGLLEQAVRMMAESDPAVQAGLRRAEVRAWYAAMSRGS